MYARHTDRAGHLRQIVRHETPPLQPVRKRGPLGLAADQTDKRQIALLALAAQAGGHHVQVFGVAEAHDEHAAARGQPGHGQLHWFRVFTPHALGCRIWKNPVAAVDPGQGKRQRRQHARQCMAYMPTTKQGHRVERWRQALLKALRMLRPDQLKPQVHHAPAALPQGRAECAALPRRTGKPAQPKPRLGNGLVFDMPPADSAHQTVGKNSHPGPHFPRSRALCRLDGHQTGRGGLQALQQ